MEQSSRPHSGPTTFVNPLTGSAALPLISSLVRVLRQSISQTYPDVRHFLPLGFHQVLVPSVKVELPLPCSTLSSASPSFASPVHLPFGLTSLDNPCFPSPLVDSSQHPTPIPVSRLTSIAITKSNSGLALFRLVSPSKDPLTSGTSSSSSLDLPLFCSQVPPPTATVPRNVDPTHRRPTNQSRRQQRGNLGTLESYFARGTSYQAFRQESMEAAGPSTQPPPLAPDMSGPDPANPATLNLSK